jgi:hypothetical protein
MFPPECQDPRPVAKGRLPVVSIASGFALAAIIAIVLFVSVRSPLKDDIAWLLYVARRWIGGRELYLDLVEVNPPLIIWISALPAEVARWLNVQPQFVAMPMFIATALCCAWWTATLLRGQGPLFATRLPVFAVIGSTLLILPGADLGQREHLLVAAFLPYLALHSQFLAGRRIPPVSAVFAGVLAAVFCALKPRYCAIFVVMECLTMLRGLPLMRAMPAVAAATLISYAGVVMIACPAYLEHAVPLALALYSATDVPFLTLLSDSVLLLAGEVIALALLVIRRRVSNRDYDLVLVLVLFAVTSTVICFIDGKDWYYHRLPATITTVLALSLWGALEIRQRRWLIRPPLVAAFAAILVFCASSIKRMEPEIQDAMANRETTVGRLEEIIRTEHARTYIAFSEWIALGFPVVNNTGVTWASRFDSMWALKGEVWRSSFDPATAQEWPIARWVVHDFIAGCPDIAVVDTRETTKYISVLSSADPAFARAWSRYRPIAAFDGLVVFKRGRGGCLDVWVAAESSKPR